MNSSLHVKLYFANKCCYLLILFFYPTSILGLQDLKPLNIVLLEPDTNDLTSILDQDKYTCYQDSLEDENYVPGIEEIALILSTKVKNFCFSQFSDSRIVGVTLCESPEI